MIKKIKNFKSKNTYIFFCLLLIFIVTPALAGNSQYIEIKSVLTGINTDPAQPGLYLIDNNNSTHWASKEGVEQVWAELQLSEKTLIQALDINGFISRETELKIEYEQSGRWLPFMAPTVKQLNGDTIIDLSYDEIVTDKIRIFLSGNGIGSSYLTELKVLGKVADKVYHKINPTGIRASVNTDSVYPATFLTDGNTYTLWKTEKNIIDRQDSKFNEALNEVQEYNNSNSNNINSPQDQAEVEFELGGIYKLDVIKFYITNYIKGDIELQVYQNGTWQILDSLDTRSKDYQPGWFRFDLTNKNVTTNLVRIIVTGTGGELGGISEVEFWGTGKYDGKIPKLIGVQRPKAMDKAVNSQFELSSGDIQEYSLELAVKGDHQNLKVELNGNLIFLEPVFNLRGYTIYRKKISKEYFLIGKNYLKVYPFDGLLLVNSRLSSSKSTNINSKLGDNLLFDAFNKSQEIEISIDNQGLPSFRTFSEAPSIKSNGSRQIEGRNKPTVIDYDVKYDNLIVNSELKLDTSNGDLEIVVKNLEMGSKGSITVIGSGSVHLYIENNLNISKRNKINGSGKENSLVVIHAGNQINIQGGIGGKDQFKFSGNIYTEASNITIQHGASFKGKLYAPDAEINLDQGAVIKGDILAPSQKVYIGNINHQKSLFRIPEIKNKINKYIEEITVYSTVDDPYINLQAMIDDKWIFIEKKDNGLKSITFKGDFKTNKLLIKNPQGLPITEVVVKYSTENNKEPKVEILKPKNNQQYTHSELSQEKIIAFVDNPDTEVTINGQQAYHRGHYFWLEANRIGGNKSNLTAVAKDNTGKINYDEKNIYIRNKQLLDVNLAEKILYTKKENLNITGTISMPLNHLTINGQDVTLSGSDFNKLIKLNDGLNLIKIEGSKLNGQDKIIFNKTIYRRVVKLTPISLEVNYPLNGYYTNKKNIIVSGLVDGLGEVEVKVNGEKAVLDGKVFISQSIELQEGSNTIQVEAIRGSERVVKKIKIIRDTVPPLLEEIYPEDGYISNKSMIVFNGQVSDSSPIQVYLNNKSSEINDLLFNNKLTFVDGFHKVKVKIYDLAGNHSNSEFQVIVDTKPPADFEVSISPSGWTNQIQPIVSFETTDETSGIDHYELAVNSGSYTKVTSPYKLPALSDGEHHITVKAIDKAGWKTISTTTAYIDTTPPTVPEYFKAVPGDDRVLLRWRKSVDSDVVKYKIKRIPEWPDNNIRYVSVEDTIKGEENYSYEFIDNEVEKNNDYTYFIQSVDRADNISEESKNSAVTVGIAKEIVTPEMGGKAEFDGIEVVIPENAVDEKANIQIKTAESVPIFENNVTSSTFSIELLDEQGNKVELNKEAQITMKYSKGLIPEGFSPFDLNIYYFNEAEARWLKFKRERINLIRDKLTINTNHFSLYSVQVTDNYSPAKEKYKDLGIAPYQSYFKNNQEYISPASGSLTINSTDINLPGRNGLNLKIARIYDVKTIMMEKLKNAMDGKDRIKGYTSFGGVWNINLPWIEKTDSGTFVHFEDGSSYKAELEKKDGKVTGYYHEGKHFYIEKKDGKYTVITKDGKKYLFNTARRIAQIIDRTGKNKITFNYSDSKIDYIIDSIGRKIDFTYVENKIKKITVGQKTYSYQYDGGKLDKVTDPAGRETEYTYTTKKYTNGVTGDLDDLKYYNLSIPVIKKINYPTGAESYYQYSELQVSESDSQYSYEWTTHNSAIVVDKHYQLEEGKKYNQLTYDYTFTDQVDDYRVTKTEVLSDEKRTLMEYNRDRQHILKTVFNRREGKKLEQIKYGYNPHIKALFLQEVYKPKKENNKLVYTYGNYYEYDNWGNVIRRENSGTKLVTKQYYLNTDSSSEEFKKAPFAQDVVNNNIHNLPAGKIVYNYDNLSGKTTTHESAYQYDQHGNMITSADYYAEKNTWLKKELRYDQYGNISMIIDADGHVTENNYNAKYKSAYLTMGKKYQQEGETYLEDADGKHVSAIVQRYGYDKNTGLKVWELDPRGYVTQYKYDKVNRLKRIIYPDEEDNEKLSGNLALLSLDEIEKNINNFDLSDNHVKIQYYDDEENITTVLNAEENIKITKAVVDAQYISGKIFNKSRYEYNGLNKLLKIKQYLTQQEFNEYYSQNELYPFTTKFKYDRMGRRVLTIDAEGKKTRKVYNELGQVTEIIYNDGSLNETSTLIDYYPTKNKRIITDPEGNKTIEVKDWGGNVIEVSKLFKDGTKYSSYAKYNSLGNKIQVVDGKGRITDFYYDSLNRVIKKKLPAGEYVIPGDKNPTPGYRPTVSYDYDNNGNKISETDANGNKTSYIYDGVNRLIKIKNNKDNIIKKYYNQAGQEIKVVNPLGNTSKNVYNSKGDKLAKIDGEGNVSYTEYDIIGNKLAEYDPRGVIPVDDNPEGYTGDDQINLNGKEYILLDRYKTVYQYDSLARKVKTVYPQINQKKIAYDEIIHYDSVGNKTKVITGEKEIYYKYYDTYWLKAEQVVTADGIRTTTYAYDKVGNKRYVTEPKGNPDNITNFSNEDYPFIDDDYTTEFIYDDLYRLKKEIKSERDITEFYYDEIGNKIKEIDAEGNITEYRYNPYNKLTKVYEAEIDKSTEYQYDSNGNMVKKIMSNSFVTRYHYNNLNQLVEESKPGNEITYYSYDDAGNLKTKINPRGIKEEYIYKKNGQIDKINYYQNDINTIPSETINYQYDRAGNRLLVEKAQSSITQSYDALGRIVTESRIIADKSYITKYSYDKYGNLTGIKYPESEDYLSYGYDELNQLKWINGLAGDKDNPAFTYNQNGQLNEMLYDNGVKTTYEYNALGRPESIVSNRTDLTTNIREKILDLNYQYDGVGNVKTRNKNNYDYDSLNRLKRAKVEGDFYLENKGTNGRVLEDYFGEESLTFTPEAWEFECDFGKKVALDYNSGSIGVAFEDEISNITKLELKTLGIADHRVKKRTLEIYYSSNNVEYTKLAEEEWDYKRDYKGDITLTIPQGINARYIKVHNKFLDWNGDFEVIDESQFVNGLEHIIKVYSRDDGATINYEYDNAGNRTKKVLRTISGNTKEYKYHYYQGTNRLKYFTINGKNALAYIYDDAGNLIKKGNKYSIEGETVTFTKTKGQSVEYYEYKYNLQNRLSTVKKNEEVIAEFQYDANGMRIKAEEQLIEEKTSKITYYVYGYSGKVLLEESNDNSSGSKYTSYIYAFGKSFARIDGVINTETLIEANITYFHYDNLGSTRLMTDREGKITFDQDYLPFGGDLPKVGQVEVQNDSNEGHKYTGQQEVVSIGLYYYGARYYDPEIGRFITEDSYRGELNNPQSQNLYIYVMNNPLRYVDPSGHRPILTDPNEQTLEQTRILNYLAYGDEEMIEATQEYLKIESRKNNNKINLSKTNTQIDMPQFNIDDILNKIKYKNIDKFINDHSIREKEIMKKFGISDPSKLKQSTTFTIDGVTAILPGDVFNFHVETSTTFNVKDGNGQYLINVSDDGISFVTPRGRFARGFEKRFLNFGLNVGKQFNIDLNNGTKISWDVGLDKLGPKIIYTFDNSKYDNTINQMNVRPFPNDRTLKTTMVVSGTVGLAVLAPKAVLVKFIPKLGPYIQNLGPAH